MSRVVDGGMTTKLPEMVPVRQIFHAPKVANLEREIETELNKDNIRSLIKAGDRVAIGVGSRGIANIKRIVHSVIQQLQQWGAKPFIVPAMGSHGGATGEGQMKVLDAFGITEESMGVPIVSNMDVVQIGSLPDRMPVYLDKASSEADAIIFVNRVKPHTGFKGDHESGLLKMLAIGLGRHKGAATVHQRPLGDMPTLLPALGEVYLSKAPIAFGLAVLENAYDETAKVIAVPAQDMISKDKELLVKAKQYMPKILPSKIDVLIVSEMGKNISGAGMDPNIIGRAASKAPQTFNAPPIERIVVIGLTKETKGNACGIGVADVITSKVFKEMNLDYMYANVITSKVLNSANIPVIMPNDRDAISVALKTCYHADLENPRIVWIKNTLEMETIWVSEGMLKEIEDHPSMEVAGNSRSLDFDEEGYLLPLS